MKLRIGAIAVAAALSLAACGSSGGSSDGSSDTSSSSASSSSSSVVSSPSDTMSASEATSPTSAPMDDAAYCAKVAEVGSQVSKLQGGLGALSSGDTAGAKAALVAAAAYFVTLQDGAPTELKAPLATLATALSQAEQEFNSSKPDAAKLAVLLTSAAPAISTFTQWAATNCAAS